MAVVKARERKDSGMSEGAGPACRWGQGKECGPQTGRMKEMDVPEEEKGAGRWAGRQP